ncbi:MAG: hypothetical protein HY252_02160 [Sphingobacteriales bacterium]|nr:hypothetical protein [Sphingobacteriales bacterium]
MTELDYILNSGCHNYNSEFTLKDGSKIPGVIMNFFNETEPDVYYYVATNNLISFKEYAERNDVTMMRTLCKKIELSEVISCVRLFPN